MALHPISRPAVPKGELSTTLIDADPELADALPRIGRIVTTIAEREGQASDRTHQEERSESR